MTFKEAFTHFFRIIFWIFVAELVYHYTVFFAVHAHAELLENASFYLTAGTLIIKGIFFAVKYIVFYGIPTFVNRLVGMKTTPLPRCVFMIHTNGELWKYFDTGLYEFIKE